MDNPGDTVIHPFDFGLDFTRYVEAVLWKARSHDDGSRTVHRFIKKRDLGRLVAWIDMHQQDPQLLDVYLHDNIPQLATAYLESLSRHSYVSDGSNPEYCLVPSAVSKILYTFCKVRGEKVILGLLNNETRHLEPLLLALERASKPQSAATSSWEERYILLLWLSLQLLAPFDLATISSIEPGDEVPQDGLHLSIDLPGIAKRLIPICLRFLKSSAREQKAAAVLLSRLCLRLDMQAIGLLNSMTEWILQSFDERALAVMSVHEALGKLQFVDYLVQFGTKDEVRELVPKIYNSCEKIFSHERFQFIQNSAVARKLRLKLMRNIAKLVLTTGFDILPTEQVVGDLISLLLDVMGDNDSLVRLAASKSLSIMTQILDPDFAEEVLSAILECLNENVLWNNGVRDLSAVNALRWHGFSLTLSHLLYRRAIPLHMLPKTLNALILSLNFEQRSATGSKLGTNVRDAANFGLWALSRRYTTDELLNIALSEINTTAVDDGIPNTIQYIAVEMLKSSCLDPAGNVRRGSSAALQELVGRHPNSVLCPVDLVQNVSYMAVGLQSNAMNAGVKAAFLHRIYWHSMVDGLVGWRGIQSPESTVRELAAQMVGQLGLSKNVPSGFDLFYMVRRLVHELGSLEPNQVEENHGLLLAIAAAISCIPVDPGHYLMYESKSILGLMKDLDLSNSHYRNGTWYYETLPVPLVVALLLELATRPSYIVPTDPNSYRSADRRPELTSAATLAIINSIATALTAYKSYWKALDPVDSRSLRECFEFCIRRQEDSVLGKIDESMFCLFSCFDGFDLEREAKLWLRDVRESGTANRYPGVCLALGTAASMASPHLSYLNQITAYEVLEELKNRCTSSVQIEARVNALEALKQVACRLLSFDCDSTEAKSWSTTVLIRILRGVVSGLNDYTINERGDVGSLVRLSALQVIKSLALFPLEDMHAELGSEIQLINIALRHMAVEKLDKVRSRVLDINSTKSVFSFLHSRIESEKQRDALSEEYFALNLSPLGLAQLSDSECRSLVNGYCSSAGFGSESVMRAARRGLLVAFDSQASNSVQGFERCVAQMIEILGSEGNKDYISVPVLETIAYLGDSGLISLLHASDVKWKLLLSKVKAAHYKSANPRKLLAAIDVYRGLVAVPDIRELVLKKLKSMLLHHYPTVRVAAAESMFLITENSKLKECDWTEPVARLKEVV